MRWHRCAIRPYRRYTKRQTLGHAETALRALGHSFGNAPQFWINLQAQYDLAVAMRDAGRLVEREVQTAA
jgi:plasmid maintenance system antidote protein VapI